MWTSMADAVWQMRSTSTFDERSHSFSRMLIIRLIVRWLSTSRALQTRDMFVWPISVITIDWMHDAQWTSNWIWVLGWLLSNFSLLCIDYDEHGWISSLDQTFNSRRGIISTNANDRRDTFPFLFPVMFMSWDAMKYWDVQNVTNTQRFWCV